jgi:hypothetical protein
LNFFAFPRLCAFALKIMRRVRMVHGYGFGGGVDGERAEYAAPTELAYDARRKPYLEMLHCGTEELFNAWD